jgi:hypothetical protein
VNPRVGGRVWAAAVLDGGKGRGHVNGGGGDGLLDARHCGVERGEGWTGLVVTRERGLRAVDGLLTGPA